MDVNDIFWEHTKMNVNDIFCQGARHGGGGGGRGVAKKASFKKRSREKKRHFLDSRRNRNAPIFFFVLDRSCRVVAFLSFVFSPGCGGFDHLTGAHSSDTSTTAKSVAIGTPIITAPEIRSIVGCRIGVSRHTKGHTLPTTNESDQCVVAADGIACFASSQGTLNPLKGFQL